MLEIDSLARLSALAEADPDTALFIKRKLAQTYDEFIDVLYLDVDAIIRKVQERKQIYCDAKEDVITMYVVDLLEARQYTVTHDTKIGGHVDIVVRGKNHPSFLWLAECKRDKGPEWLDDGFQQLCRRYSDGGQFNGHGGILLYCQGKYAARILGNWRTHLATKDAEYEGLAISDCTRNPGLAFVSEHIHDTSGLPYKVRHMGVALYHSPTV